MEIIIFAVLAGYLFFRLWSVLGTRTGNEKPLNPSQQQRFEVAEKDNIIVMPKAGKNSVTEESNSVIANQLSQLRELIPDFDDKSFIHAAENAFVLIIKAYSDDNKKLLKQLLEETVYEQFCAAIYDRQQKNLRQEVEIESVLAELVSIENVGRKVQLTVRFQSEQMIATFNEADENIDNPARLKNLVTDLWTFEKPLKTKDPTWLLVRTSADTV